MDLRQILYPLGFAASLLFGGRFVVQWIQSEIKGSSIVTPLFWRLSIAGNALLMIHAFIQVQYPLCLAQSLNLVISWRNLDMMRDRRFKRSRVITSLCLAPLLVTTAFVIQGFLDVGHLDWVRTPTLPWMTVPAERLSLSWHIFGAMGIFFFSSRFWVQWWLAEKRGVSTLDPSFWWSSLIGALLALVYFLRLGDSVNILGMGMGIIPYARNLSLGQRIKG